MAGLIDRRAIREKQSLEHNLAVFIELPVLLRDDRLYQKKCARYRRHGLRVGDLETKEDALRLVKAMRMGRSKADPLYEPAGLRLGGGGIAASLWGLTGPQYLQRADTWPLNPRGDLLAFATIETELGLRNMDEIAQFPGIGLLYFTSGGDLGTSWVCRLPTPRSRRPRKAPSRRPGCGRRSRGSSSRGPVRRRPAPPRRPVRDCSVDDLREAAELDPRGAAADLGIDHRRDDFLGKGRTDRAVRIQPKRSRRRTPAAIDSKVRGGAARIEFRSFTIIGREQSGPAGAAALAAGEPGAAGTSSRSSTATRASRRRLTRPPRLRGRWTGTPNEVPNRLPT